MNNFCKLFVFIACLIPGLSWANHVKVNCGPLGFWDSTQQTAPAGYYVWIMNDDTVQIKSKTGNSDWTELGKVNYSRSSDSINEIELASFGRGDQFKGNQFQMVLEDEFTRDRQKKDRRFFRAAFSAGKVTNEKIECVFGLK